MSSNDITELRRTADLALRATKGTAHAIGRSMAALVAAERHLWLTLSDIREKDRVFLLDAPLAPSGLFGDTVESVVDRHQEARKQAAAFQRFLPLCSSTQAAAGRKQPQPRSSSSYREAQKQSVALGRGPSSSPELLQRGNCTPWSGNFSLHGAETASSTQSTARLVQFCSSCRPTPPRRFMWWRYRPTTPLLVDNQWAATPWLHVSSTVRWGWGLQYGPVFRRSPPRHHGQSYSLSGAWPAKS